jgi:hypothetical protein|tara:strand:+ start:1428 stop:1616 length:189 start_codon:yes stop_codon:yes gene_type:complete
MEIIGMKKKYSFTIDEQLMNWFRVYVREESTTMSAIINQYILNLKRGGEKPKNILYSNQMKH